MNTIFQNTTACPPQTDPGLTAARTNIAQPATSPFAAYCATLNDDSGCKNGLETELVTCGFSTAAQVTSYCSANGSDPCCAKAAEATDATLKTIAKGLAPVNNTPWIASGIALGVMVFFALVFIFCIKMKPWKKASTSASEPPPSEIEPGPLRADTLKDGAGTGPFGRKRRTSLFSAVRQSIMGIGGRSKVAPPPLPTNSYPTMKSAMQSVYSNPAPPQSMYTDAPPPQSMYNDPPPMPSNAYSVYSSAPPPILPPITTPTQPLVQMKVVEPYAAQLGDELSLMIGDVVTVEEEYDDGWGVGRNESTGEVGAFPVTCLEPLDYSVQGERPKSVIGERTKSLYASGFRN
ncbi:hypothetical protein SpCBS45565_g06738 [Spizellomyces sp. 'palustris']|nr:hypothetical protein SpCBS45565_g06738 [Spizellomyces sp. 'palustris']